MDKVILIVGPTGVGKTKLSLDIAQAFNFEIINGDAIQVFRDVNILSAKIKKDEMRGIKHYLIDICQVDESYDVARFKEDATYIIKHLNRLNIVPIVVGGSGLYVKALLYDYDFNSVVARNMTCHAKYDVYNNEQLFNHLESIDKDAASILHPNNRQRVMRAIEIYETSGNTKTSIIESQTKQMIFDAYVIGLNLERSLLYERINNRVDEMINNGLVEEVMSLLNTYGNNNYQAFNAIGFKELIPCIIGELNYEDAYLTIKQNSRRYAKKQMTWFRNQMDINWYDVDIENFTKTSNKVIDDIKEWLNESV